MEGWGLSGKVGKSSRISRQQARESESAGSRQLRKSFSWGVEWPKTLSGCRKTLSVREGKRFALTLGHGSVPWCACSWLATSHSVQSGVWTSKRNPNPNRA
jgi:hypothetical protein